MFSRARVAVFVDGCFWHGCPEHFHAPRVNSSSWAPKIARNQECDLRVDADLEREGWTVLRFWEHESTDSVARRIDAAVRAKQAPV
jgi:DNA mismatch endonuclease (patch repair protein)